GSQQAGFDQRASESLGLVASPLVPKSTADESRERNNRGDHQTQKPRSNAAEHGHSRPSLGGAVSMPSRAQNPPAGIRQGLIRLKPSGLRPSSKATRQGRIIVLALIRI